MFLLYNVLKKMHNININNVGILNMGTLITILIFGGAGWMARGIYDDKKKGNK